MGLPSVKNILHCCGLSEFSTEELVFYASVAKKQMKAHLPRDTESTKGSLKSKTVESY